MIAQASGYFLGGSCRFNTQLGLEDGQTAGILFQRRLPLPLRGQCLDQVAVRTLLPGHQGKLPARGGGEFCPMPLLGITLL